MKQTKLFVTGFYAHASTTTTLPFVQKLMEKLDGIVFSSSEAVENEFEYLVENNFHNTIRQGVPPNFSNIDAFAFTYDDDVESGGTIYLHYQTTAGNSMDEIGAIDFTVRRVEVLTGEEDETIFELTKLTPGVYDYNDALMNIARAFPVTIDYDEQAVVDLKEAGYTVEVSHFGHGTRLVLEKTVGNLKVSRPYVVS